MKVLKMIKIKCQTCSEFVDKKILATNDRFVGGVSLPPNVKSMCIECYIEYRDEMEYKHRENNR